MSRHAPSPTDLSVVSPLANIHTQSLQLVCIVRLARERSAAGPIRSETVPRHVRLEPPALVLASNEALGRPLRGRQHRRRLIDVSLGDLGLPFGPVLQPTMVGHRVRKPSPVAGAPQTVWASLGSVVPSVIRPVVGETVCTGTAVLVNSAVVPTTFVPSFHPQLGCRARGGPDGDN